MATLSLQRSKKLLEQQGFKVAIVERWNQWAHKRQDLYGLADLIAVKGDRSGTTYVQACGEDCQAHIEKMTENTVLPDILKAGNPVFLWAWRLREHEGTKPTWQLREIEFQLKEGSVICVENSVKPS